jgi:hypothetical protein
VPSQSRSDQLIDELVTHVERLGGTIPRAAAARQLNDSVTAVARHLRVSPGWALKRYFDDDWPREMSEQLMGLVRQRSAAPERTVSVSAEVAARTVAALGQVLFYAGANSRDRPLPADLNLAQMGEAVTSLSLRLDSRTSVDVSLNTAGYAARALRMLAGKISSGAWSQCPCGEEHGQSALDRQVLAALQQDLEALDVLIATGVTS